MALFFSLISGIFHPAFLIKQARAATALTNVLNTLTSTQSSATTTHQINFTTYTDIPATSTKILITFPAGFSVAGVTFNAWSGFDGGQAITTSSQVITITRDGAGATSTAGGKYIKLNNIVNTSATGTSHTVTVETQDSAAATLDGPTTSYYFSICTNACHTLTYQIPWTSTVSTSTKHTSKFTTATSTPADAKIKLTFPSGFDVSGTTYSTSSDFDGGFNLSVSGQTLTLTRDGTGTTTAAGAKYIVLSNITNHSTASSSYYVTLETTDASDTNIEGPTSIRFSINNTGLGGLANTPMPWPHQNAKAQNRSPYQGPTYGTVKWAYTIAGSSFASWLSTPVIGSDGTIYVPNQTNNKLYALNTDGTVKWTTSDLGGDIAGPTISSNGTLYIHVNGRGIYTVDSTTGVVNQLFVDHCSQYYSTGPPQVIVASDGTIIFATCKTAVEGGDGKIQYLGGLNPDGTLKWKNFDVSQRYGAPSIGSDDTVYLSDQWSSFLNAANSDGVTKWQASLTPGGYNGMSTPAIDDSGVAYIINGDRVYAINSDGTQKWASYQAGATGATYGASVGISPDNNIVYYGARDTKFYALNAADGTLKWLFNAGGGIFLGSPMIGADGMVYFGHNKFYVFTPAGNLKWSYNSAGEATPTIISNGTMYTVNDDGYVYAFQPWTLSGSVNPSGLYKAGDTISFTATTTMLAADPVTSEANQVQVYLEDSTIVPLTCSATSSDYSTWTGTYVVPATTTDNTYTATIEAAAVNVVTDIDTHFANPPTNSTSSAGASTGVTSTVSYIVDSTAPTGSSFSFSSVEQTSITVYVTGVQDATAGLADLPYYFERDNGNNSSGWQSAASWQDTGLTGCQKYNYKVKVKDKSGNIQELSQQTQQTINCAVVMVFPISAPAPTPTPAVSAPAEEAPEAAAPAATEAPAPEAAPPTAPPTTAAIIQQVKTQIVVIQQKLVELITQLIQLIQAQIAELQGQI